MRAFRARLVLARGVYDAVVRHLIDALPHEGVGLLATEQTVGVDGCLRATRFYPGTNIDASPTRFTMDPAEVLVALREIDEHGWWLGAIVHSHPVGPATPSATDRREARYPDALTVIASLTERPVRLRAWRLPFDGEVADVTEVAEGTEVPVLIEGQASGLAVAQAAEAAEAAEDAGKAG